MAAIMSCYGSYRGAHRREGTAWCSRLGDHPGVHIGWGEGSRGTRATGFSSSTRVLTGRVLKGLEGQLGVPPHLEHGDLAFVARIENRPQRLGNLPRKQMQKKKNLELLHKGLKHACECLT